MAKSLTHRINLLYVVHLEQNLVRNGSIRCGALTLLVLDRLLCLHHNGLSLKLSQQTRIWALRRVFG